MQGFSISDSTETEFDTVHIITCTDFRKCLIYLQFAVKLG